VASETRAAFATAGCSSAVRLLVLVDELEVDVLEPPMTVTSMIETPELLLTTIQNADDAPGGTYSA
jgi:hypothetical protein